MTVHVDTTWLWVDLFIIIVYSKKPWALVLIFWTEQNTQILVFNAYYILYFYISNCNENRCKTKFNHTNLTMINKIYEFFSSIIYLVNVASAYYIFDSIVFVSFYSIKNL